MNEQNPQTATPDSCILNSGSDEMMWGLNMILFDCCVTKIYFLIKQSIITE